MAASTSTLLFTLKLDSQSSQAMHLAPLSSAGDAIPFGAALTLSSLAVAAATSQICGCFLPSIFRPWQLAICCIFFASSASLFGVVFSRFYDNHSHQDAYLILVLFCSVWPPIYEIGFLYKLFDKICIAAQRVCVGTIIIMFLLAVGLCIWLGEKTNELSLILKPLLFANCGAYTGLLMGYLYLASNAKKNRFAMWLLLTNCFLCSLIPILTCVLLGVDWARVISADLVLWILLTSSSAITFRFPVLLSQKELIKSLFGFTGLTEPHMRSLTTMAGQSTRQDSTTSLFPPPALQISADVEAGTNNI